jgi:beta-barrel assembly-enhancing protease
MAGLAGRAAIFASLLGTAIVQLQISKDAVAPSAAASFLSLARDERSDLAGDQSPPAEILGLRDADERVARIAYAIAIGAAPLCARKVPVIGATLHHLTDYPRSRRNDIDGLFGMRAGPGVAAVVRDGPAYRAGLRPGDAIVAVDNHPLQPAVAANAGARAADRDAGYVVEQRLAALLTTANGGDVPITYLRGGQRRSARIAPVFGCAAAIYVNSSGGANAFANGRYVVMSEKLVGLAPDDDTLAAWVSHELAHNLLGHAAQRAANRAIRVRAQELQADAYSIRLMRAGGFDPRAAPRAWRLLYRNRGLLALLPGQHPQLADRLRVIDAAIAQPTNRR